MNAINTISRAAFAGVCMFACLNCAGETEAVRAQSAMVQFAANRLDRLLFDIERSVEALGAGVARSFKETSGSTDAAAWADRMTVTGKTAGFRTWPEGDEPTFQAAFPGLYSYNGKKLDADIARALDALDAMTPTFRVAFETFDFSWVYFTTASEVMMIYPYLPMDEAVNNFPPTAQVYYQSADFKARKAGWTPPYLDLVGAGMMVTASYPAFDGEKLIGVASRDVTLDQLAGDLLNHATIEDGDYAFLVDARGLLIDANDSPLSAEMKAANEKIGAAKFFLRTDDELPALGVEGARHSERDWLNTAVSHLIAVSNRGEDNPGIHFQIGDKRVLASRLKAVDWWFVLVADQR